jgi:hypothetical protein
MLLVVLVCITCFPLVALGYMLMHVDDWLASRWRL